MSVSHYDLIIFDCDGTLVDSEGLNNQCCSDVLHQYGFEEYTQTRCIEDFAGRSWNEIKIILEERHDVALPPEIVSDYIALVQDRIKTADISIAGARDFVCESANRYKIAVGSNGERSNVFQGLELQGFMDYFSDDTVFTKVQVDNPKPAPDLFLLAAEKMGVDPSRCLVLEDSPTGVVAGVAAGMDVWGFVGVAHDPKMQEKTLIKAGASRVFNDFIHIGEALGY